MVHVIAAGLDHLAADSQDGVRPGRSQPEVTVVHQEGGTVLLRRDWIGIGPLQANQIGHANLAPRGGTLVLANGAAHNQRRFLRQLFAQIEERGLDISLKYDTLADASPVAELEEMKLPYLLRIYIECIYVMLNYKNGNMKLYH